MQLTGPAFHAGPFLHNARRRGARTLDRLDGDAQGYLARRTGEPRASAASGVILDEPGVREAGHDAH